MVAFNGNTPLNQDMIDLFIQLIDEGLIPESYRSFLDNAEWMQGSNEDDTFAIRDPDLYKSYVIDSGDGFDRITLGKADDVYFGGSGRDFVSDQRGDDVILGGDGRDVLNGYVGDDIIFGGNGNDRLLGWNGNDVLYGGAGNDFLRAGQDSNTLYGGDGDDELLLESWAGEPDISFSPNASKIHPTEPIEITNVLDGGAGSDTFTFRWLIDATPDAIAKHTVDGVVDWRGVAGENEFPHQHWVETMGDNVIVADYDPLEDHLVFEGHTIELTSIEYVDADGDGDVDDSVVKIHSNNGNNTTHHLDHLGTITILNNIITSDDISINNAVYYGVKAWWESNTFGPDRDTIALDQDDIIFFLDKINNGEIDSLLNDDILEAYWMQGDDMNNHIHGSDLEYQVLDGGIGNDTLHGSSGSDVLFGGSGDDSLFGRDGIDYLIGGSGDDYLNGGLQGDYIWGRDGYDTLSYADSFEGVAINWKMGVGSGGTAEGDQFEGIERIVLSSFDDILHGTMNADTADGGDGHDYLKGYGGDDVLFGGNGRDILNGGAGADLINGGNGRDWAYYSEAPSGVSVDLSMGAGLGGDAMGDVLVSIENIRGSNHADVLKGDNSANIIYGSEGDDLLEGSGGNDVLSGGSGADRFVFNEGDGHDRIIDFELGIDKIVISVNDVDFGDMNIYTYNGTSIIKYSDGGYIFMENVAIEDITESIFDFV